MISINELLDSPIYTAWLKKIPTLKQSIATTPPWFLYVKRSGQSWRRRAFEDYQEGLQALYELVEQGCEDAALSAKRQEFTPPIVKSGSTRYYWPMPPAHSWCGYCRRPVVYRYFRQHHAFGKHTIMNTEKRCPICGMKQNGQRRYT